MKNSLASLTLAFGLLLAIGIEPVMSADAGASNDSKKNVSFLWSFATLRGDADGLEPVPSGLLELDPGDTSRMWLEPLAPCFIYVILRESSGDMHLLYPDPISDGGKRAAASAGESSYIPNQGWFSVDDEAGEETIYLLASATRLDELERLMNEYSTGLGDREGRAKNVVAHIVDLRREHWNPRTLEEKPAMIAGKTRGSGNRTCVSCLATEISASDFFTRTFTIEHFDPAVARTQDP